MLDLLVKAWRERERWFSSVARRAHKIWRDWRGLLLFVAIMLVFRSAVADWNQVPSGSMKPGILDGDRIVVDKLAWDLRVPFTDLRIAQWSNPARGDVVTFVNPLDGRLFVKRVVAVPGDVVELRMKQLIVNGERARYTRLPKRGRSRATDRECPSVPLLSRGPARGKPGGDDAQRARAPPTAR